MLNNTLDDQLLVMIMQSDYVLPLVEISKLNSPNLEDRSSVAQALDQACKEVGFLYLKGEQFQPELFENLCRISAQYFARDQQSKMQHYIGSVTKLRSGAILFSMDGPVTSFSRLSGSRRFFNSSQNCSSDQLST